MKNLTIILIMLLFRLAPICADEWLPAGVLVFKSDNGKFILKVFPTVIPENYYKWKTASPNKRLRFKGQDTAIVLCHAKLSRVEGNDTVEIWNKKLINSISPVYAIVANDGQFVVTFDNWGGNGNGQDVMVIYDASGGLVKRYKLEEISPFHINNYPTTVSSINWRCWTKYTDNKSLEICFQPESGEKKIMIFKLDSLDFAD